MTQRRLRIQDYTVGWICALPIELAAATEMLDEEHQDLPQDSNDTNLYALGRIGEHNVVLACLPAGQMGTSSAAAIAIQMQSKFTSLRFGLMVGIGGGVPSAESDVRLGDVVISQPHMQHGGVVQYDFGKTGASGFTRTGSLNAPPTVLLNALAKLQSNHLRRKSSPSVYLSAVSHSSDFTYGNAGPDMLFEPTYNHIGGPTCDRCSRDKLVERTSRRNQDIVVHYGTIASGNQVVKDGVVRDKLSSELGGVLCFEMEAAGLMNNFPCLVIRGICDYADSHKNKRWQPYAAATAAACAKELLSIVPAAEVAKTRTVDEANNDSDRLQNDLAKTINHGGSIFSGSNHITTGRIIQLGNLTMGDGNFTLN
jgi:nucleoside phosphorylase